MRIFNPSLLAHRIQMRKRRPASIYFVCFAALMLVAQLVIASGHVHLAGSQSDYAQASSVLLSESGDQAPADKRHSGHDGFCPLCWAQGMAGSLLIPTAPLLEHPAPIASSQSVIFPGHIGKSASPSSFNPRAPPVSAPA